MCPTTSKLGAQLSRWSRWYWILCGLLSKRVVATGNSIYSSFLSVRHPEASQAGPGCEHGLVFHLLFQFKGTVTGVGASKERPGGRRVTVLDATYEAKLLVGQAKLVAMAFKGFLAVRFGTAGVTQSYAIGHSSCCKPYTLKGGE